MKISAHRPITRRSLIKGLGGAALLLPQLELFERQARAQTVARRSKFAVFCYTPDGVNENAFWPTGTTSSWTLSNTLKAFEPYRDKILILGPQMNGAVPRVGTGLVYKTVPPQHQAPVTLAARAGNLPYTNPQANVVNRIDGPSIDQVIAKAIKGDSTFGSLNFGMHPIGGDTPSDINFLENGTPLKRLEGADEAWKYVFGNLPGMGTATTVSPLSKLNAVSTFLHARFSALTPRLSAADRTMLDGHLTAMRSYEERLRTRLGTTTPPTTNTKCTNPTRAAVKTDAESIRTGVDTETLTPFFMDIIATAFACNLTKVASVSFGYPGGGDAGGLRMPWLGFNDPLHFVSHHAGNAAKLDKYQKMNGWVASQVAGLMQRLAAQPSATGTGTLLDETTIYWFNRHGDGDTHSNDRLPNILLGGTGGYFRMGRWLQLPATNPTKVLISIAQAFGVPQTTFGEAKFSDTAPLSDLT